MGGGGGYRTSGGRLFHGGRWRDEETWPLARTQYTKYYLHGDGTLAAHGATADGGDMATWIAQQAATPAQWAAAEAADPNQDEYHLSVARTFGIWFAALFTLGIASFLWADNALYKFCESVVVGVSAPHREEAFAAGRWCIDTLKETVPIWKREVWEGGEHWGLDTQHIVAVTGVNARRPGETEAPLAVVPIDQQVGRESSGDRT